MPAGELGGPLRRGPSGVRLWLILGGLNGALAVAVLAAASHGRIGGSGSHSAELAELGARFELIHGVLLVALSAAARVLSSRLVTVAAVLIVAGCVLFSGGLYLDALTGAFAFLVPFGGLAFILGWLCLAAAGLRGRALV